MLPNSKAYMHQDSTGHMDDLCSITLLIPLGSDLLREELSLSYELSLSIAGNHCLHYLLNNLNTEKSSGDSNPRQHASLVHLDPLVARRLSIGDYKRPLRKLVLIISNR